VKETVKTGRLIRFGSYEVNLRSGELCRDGERVRLPEQSFQILAMLVEHPGEVVMRQEIQKRLWPNDTVVEFENSINAAVKRLRVALEDSADAPRYVETLARRGYRWMAPVEWVEAIPSQIPDQAVRKPLWKILTPIAAFLLLGVFIWWWLSRLPVSAARLTDKDTIVLADFANSTGDPIFDETLRPALRSSLQQSPFLNILSERRVGVALKLMKKPADARLTPEIALDLCRREQSKHISAEPSLRWEANTSSL